MSKRLGHIAIAAIVVVIAAIAFAPALDAGFHREDFPYLALMRHIDSPWPLVSGNLFFTYYYRATGLLFWWLSVQIAGTDAWWHNLFDLVLQASSAALLGMLAARLGRNRIAGLIAGVVFACLPAASSTAMWMSDRYDPLALLFGLSSLIAFENALEGGRRWALSTALLLFLAITAKEVAYAIAAVMLLRIAWQVWTTRQWPMSIIAAVVAPVFAALALRVLTVYSLESALDQHDLGAAMISGVTSWWDRLPLALFGFRAPASWLWWLLGAVGLLALVSLMGAIRARRGDVARLAFTGSMLLLLPAVMQWPVTSLILPENAALNFSVNLRFYYLATAGIALLFAATWLALRRTSIRVAFAIGSAMLCTVWFLDARDNAHNWAQDAAAPMPRYANLGRDLSAYTFSPGCRVFFDSDSVSDYARPYIDAIAKASATPGASIMNCSISAGISPFTTFVGSSQCNEAAWPGLQIKTLANRPVIAALGNLCGIVFISPNSTADNQAPVNFHVDGTGHLSRVDAATPSN